MHISHWALTLLITLASTSQDIRSQGLQQKPLPRRFTLPEGLVLELGSGPDTAVFRPAFIQYREHYLTREHVIRVAPQVLLLSFAGRQGATGHFQIVARAAATPADTGSIYPLSGTDNVHIEVMTDSAGTINEFSILFRSPDWEAFQGLQAAASRAWGPPSSDGGRMTWRDAQTQIVLSRNPNGPVDLRVRACPRACW